MWRRHGWVDVGMGGIVEGGGTRVGGCWVLGGWLGERLFGLVVLAWGCVSVGSGCVVC